MVHDTATSNEGWIMSLSTILVIVLVVILLVFLFRGGF